MGSLTDKYQQLRKETEEKQRISISSRPYSMHSLK